MKHYNVKFMRTDGSREILRQTTVTAADGKKALSKAVKQIFGRGAFFFANLELGWDYGQVFRKIRGAAHSYNLTPRVRVDVDEVPAPPVPGEGAEWGSRSLEINARHV